MSSNSVFERFGIKHLSPSSLNCWREAPAIWAMRYLGKIKDAGNEKTWRGSSLEEAVTAVADGDSDNAHLRVLSQFEGYALGDDAEDIEKERKALVGFVEQVKLAMAGEPRAIVATQQYVEMTLPGIEIPVVGYVDYLLEGNAVFDLKSTKALPSKPRINHVRQVSIYKKAIPGCESAQLLYVTPKKFAWYPVSDEDADLAIASLQRDALTLQRFLSKVDNFEDAILSLPVDPEHYMFNVDFETTYDRVFKDNMVRLT